MEIKKGDTYEGGKVISTGIQKAMEMGSNGRSRLPVRKEYIGRQWVVVQYSDYSTKRFWL